MDYVEKGYIPEVPMVAESLVRKVPQEQSTAITETREGLKKEYEAGPLETAVSPARRIPPERYLAVSETVTTADLSKEKPDLMDFVKKSYKTEPPMISKSSIREIPTETACRSHENHNNSNASPRRTRTHGIR
ncbi:hypothetical protein KIN20_021870 [Parelaphostrongylus tenuis]|uniref:Uncharacterized protein n=1 Tax=Parelaphostrongylus tenuis TaxID=148309 RepID=A0AAD5N5N5_PARTN|nr:hypothetical protein KIN20_021870 [Parelaphostrongylus tenuis]